MSTKKILGIEKGIERSISPKRDAVLMSRAHLLQPPQQPEVKPEDTVPMNLDITKLLIRKQEKKRLEKKRIKQKEQGGVARIAKKPGSPLSSSSSVSSISSVSISPNDIIAFEEEQRREATRHHQGSPKSVSPSLSPLGRRASIEEAAEARRNSSSSASASSSSSSSSPRFEKFDSWSMSPTSPKGKGRQGGSSRRRRTAHKKRKTHHKSKRVHHTRRKNTRRHRRSHSRHRR
jgi:hypothetical protein